MSAWLRTLVREPVTHFAIIGVALFGLDAALSSDEGTTSETPGATAEARGGPAVPRGPIVVDASVRERLAVQWERVHDGPPSAEQLEGLVREWVDEEVLYREGLARGLAEGDLQVRERVASQMAYVLRSRTTIAEPSEAELRAWLEAHPERYAQPERVDFTQVFVSGTDDAAQSRAHELLRLLQGGADPDGLGDTFSGGRRFRGRKPADLAARFGDAFADGLLEQAAGTWALRRSTVGLHLVRIDRVTAGEATRFEEVRERLRHDWEEAARARALADAVGELRSRWEVTEAP